MGSAQGKKRLKFFHAARGPKLEPFEDLKHEVQRHLEPRLREKWDRLSLPFVCPYPGFPRITVFGYLLAFGMALAVPVAMVVGLKTFLVENALLAALGIGTIAPFFVRDYRRSQRKLSIERAGLRQTNGGEVFIPWSAITELMLREPAEIGYGSLVVASDDGSRIDIPRSLNNFGAVWHLVKKHTTVVESYGFAM